MKGNTTHQLNIKMTLAKGAFGGFTNQCKHINQKIVFWRTISYFLADISDHSANGIILETGKIGFAVVNLLNQWLHRFDDTVIRAAKQVFCKRRKHRNSPAMWQMRCRTANIKLVRKAPDWT